MYLLFIVVQIYVRSSDSERAMQTGLAFLAGLYPPDANQSFETGLNWQPVPVHTFIPKKKDIVSLGLNILHIIYLDLAKIVLAPRIVDILNNKFDSQNVNYTKPPYLCCGAVQYNCIFVHTYRI